MKSDVKTKSKILEGLNPLQESAVTYGEGPFLIVAGAGTGKTTVITKRIAWLIEQGKAQPEDILALTFTEKAATEMQERVDQIMPLGYADMDISTFHSFAQKILNQHALEIGLPGDFKVLTKTKAWMMVRNHINEFDLDYYKPLGNPNKFIHALLEHFNKLKGEQINKEDYLKYAESLHLNSDTVEIKKRKHQKKEPENPVDEAEISRILEVANAYHKYQKLLLDNSCLDFGDLINYAIKLFISRPKVLLAYQKKYKYILVDEFQDTDLSQYALVKMLAMPENNITVVGDDDQSIYKFRGASISNILKFKEDFVEAKEVTLIDNYRSSQKILDLAYNFIQLNNPERLESKLSISKKLVSNKLDAGNIEVLHEQTVYDEAKKVTETIINLTEKENLTWNDFAILVRANDHADPFIAEMGKAGIPYIFVANRGLYKKPIILDILAYFKLLDNYHESENLFRVLNMQRFKIDNLDLINLSSTAKRKALSLYEVLKRKEYTSITPITIATITELITMIEKHTNWARTMPVSELLIKTLNDLSLIRSLANDSIESSENRNYLEQFYRKTLQFEQDSDDHTLKSFLNQIRSELDSGDEGELSFNPDVGPEAVKIMTIHSSKGLEFQCVFVANMVEQRFPSRDRREQIEIPSELIKEILSEGDVHLMEERRLFYVAVTRAKNYLFLTWADDYGGTTQKKPSRFLIEANLSSIPTKSKPAGEVFFKQQPTLPKLQKMGFALPESFDFSQISTFLKCPLEYKYKYIYHLPMPGSAPFSFGATIHATLKKFSNSVIQLNSAKQNDLFGSKLSGEIVIPKKEVLLKFYEESWIDDWYPDKINKDKYKKAGLAMLENFYHKTLENPFNPKYLEQSFKMKIGDYKFKGRIDRADLNKDGSISIIDYKTGEIRTKLEKVDKEQLLIYQWAATECLNNKVAKLTYWYLKGKDSTLDFLGTNEEIAQLKEKILQTIKNIAETIKTNSFYEADLHSKGHQCQFRDLEPH